MNPRARIGAAAFGPVVLLGWLLWLGILSGAASVRRFVGFHGNPGRERTWRRTGVCGIEWLDAQGRRASGHLPCAPGNPDGDVHRGGSRTHTNLVFWNGSEAMLVDLGTGVVVPLAALLGYRVSAAADTSPTASASAPW